MIFQQFNLVRRHSVMANVLSGALGQTSLATSLLMRFSEEERLRALACLDRVGLPGRESSRADALSGGLSLGGGMIAGCSTTSEEKDMAAK